MAALVKAVNDKFLCPHDECSSVYDNSDSLRKHCDRKHIIKFTIRAPRETPIEEKKRRHRQYCAKYRANKKKKAVRQFREPLCAIDADTRGVYGCDDPLLEYRQSSIEDAGNGLFACEDFQAGDIVTWYSGEMKTMKPEDPSYSIRVPKGYLDGIRIPRVGEGMASFVNREERAMTKSRKNCSIVRCPGEKYPLYLEISKTVKAGSELYTNYSRGYRIYKNK